VQLVSASSPSHQVLGSKPSLCRISAGVRLYFAYSLSQTRLVWEPLALDLPIGCCIWGRAWEVGGGTSGPRAQSGGASDVRGHAAGDVLARASAARAETKCSAGVRMRASGC
jgi:hypothetical protein